MSLYVSHFVLWPKGWARRGDHGLDRLHWSFSTGESHQDRAEDVAAMPFDLPTVAELREHIGVHESKTGSCLATLCPA